METEEQQAAPRRASLPLHVVVIGGGFSGLATAYAIQKAGHTVEVLEAEPAASVDYHCAYIPPNMFKALNRLGILEEVERRSSKLATIIVHDEEGRQTLVHCQERVVKEGSYGLSRIFRSDLRDIAFKLATDAGVKVTYNSKAVGVDLDGPCVMLENGHILDADLIVGADGVEGAVRGVVLENEDKPQTSGYYFFHGIIPVDILKADEQFERLGAGEGIGWWYSDHAASMNPVGPSNSFYTAVYVWKASEAPQTVEPACTKEFIRSAFSGRDSRIQRAIDMMQHIRQIHEVHREPLQEWSHETGRLVLMGNAAHPMMFPRVQEAALALEDAQVLGSFLSRLASRDQLPYLLEAYQEVRQLRCEIMAENEHVFRAAMVGAALGSPNVSSRAEQLMQEMENEFSKGATWLNSPSIFDYDACAEADAWWERWGDVLGGPRSSEQSSDASLPPSSPERLDQDTDNDIEEDE